MTRKDKIMPSFDLKKYSGRRFIKPDHVRDHPLRDTIVGITEGKFGKLELLLETGWQRQRRAGWQSNRAASRPAPLQRRRQRCRAGQTDYGITQESETAGAGAKARRLQRQNSVLGRVMRGSGPYLDWTARARAVPIVDEIRQRGINNLKHVGDEYVGPCPKCGGDDRFAVHTKKNIFNCRNCNVGGDTIQFVEHLDSVDFKTACERLVGPQPKAKPNGKSRSGQTEIIAAEFQYHDENWNTLLVVERIEFQKLGGDFVLKDGKHDKTFKQKRPDPEHRGKWIHNADGVPLVPYHLPQLLEAIASSRPILIVEGEAKANLLWSWNIAATCCVGGAKKWKAEHSEFLRGADVFLLPDNDNAGWEHIHKIGASLSVIARSIRVVALPVPLKGDIIDWANAGGTREKLDELLATALTWRLPTAAEQKDKAKKHEDELIDGLAKTQGLDYVRQRKDVASELGVSAADWITEPWPDPVDGDSLLRDIIFRFRRHVICSHEDLLTIALWVCFAWVHNDIARHSPMLMVSSAEPESGKTTTLSVLSYLAPRAIASVDISDAALYRTIQRWQPSFIIDEFDTVLASEEKQELRSIINSGHVRGQGVIRCIGDDKTPELFPTFCPKAIGLVGRKLPASTLSRSIIIELRRQKKDEAIEEFAYEDDSELGNLCRRLLRWSLDNAEILRNAKASMPPGFDNRRSDNWRLAVRHCRSRRRGLGRSGQSRCHQDRAWVRQPDRWRAAAGRH
jgi:hypothetical protein